MAGVVLVVAASGLPDVARTVAAAVPAIAFIGMGIALLRNAIKPVPDPFSSRLGWRTCRPGSPTPKATDHDVRAARAGTGLGVRITS
jgi:hypothetical protein